MEKRLGDRKDDKKNLVKQKSKGEPTRSSTGGPQKRGRRIVPVSNELLSPGPGLLNRTKVLGKPPQNLKERNASGNERRKKDESSSSVSSWGTGAYHWTPEFRDEMKAEADGWGMKRIASERKNRTLMAGGSITS